MAEFYHTGQGFSDREWNDYLAFTKAAQQSLTVGNVQPLALANAQFTPLGMSKDYTFVRLLWPIQANRLELETIVVTSLRDGSSVVQPTISRRLGVNWTVYLVYSQFYGSARSEFGNVQIRRSTDIGIRYHFSFKGKAAHDK